MAIQIEQQIKSAGFHLIAGADEAGRGACAGPLVAAAVILGPEPIAKLDDSKRFTAKARDYFFDVICEQALAFSVVEVSPAECDLGLQVANISAIRRAILRLEVKPDYVLVDGFQVDGLTVPSLGVWKGDQISAAVSAASIIAKVTRDRLMKLADKQWPEYGFDRHKGYGTATHQEALIRYGPCPIHRLSYDNVARAVAEHDLR